VQLTGSTQTLNALKRSALPILTIKVFIYSIVLQAVWDAKYCFTFFDIDAYGSIDDASVLSETLYGTAFDEVPTKLNLPSPVPVEGQNLT